MSNRSVAVVGAGLIGRAWAITFARAGKEVRLYDSIAGAAGSAMDFISGIADDLAAANLSGGLTAQQLCANIRAFDSLADAVEGVVHVQESTFEQLDIKIALYRELDALVAAQVPIASSTSGFIPSLFSADLAGQGRCIVAHPINPPYLVPAVEIVPAPWTTRATIDGLPH